MLFIKMGRKAMIFKLVILLRRSFRVQFKNPSVLMTTGLDAELDVVLPFLGRN